MNVQFDLYCDNAWVPEFMTTMQGLGCLLGAMLWGQLGEVLGRRWARQCIGFWVILPLTDPSHHLCPRRCCRRRWQLRTQLATRRCRTFLRWIPCCWILEHLLRRISRSHTDQMARFAVDYQ